MTLTTSNPPPILARPRECSCRRALLLAVLAVNIGPIFMILLLVGFFAGYMIYLFGHDAMHHSVVLPGSWLKGATQRHQAHHATGATTDYGIVFPLWDIVFRTRSA